MIEWLSQYSGLVTLVGFFAFFAGIALWTYAPRNKDVLARHAYIPLKETEE